MFVEGKYPKYTTVIILALTAQLSGTNLLEFSGLLSGPLSEGWTTWSPDFSNGQLSQSLHFADSGFEPSSLTHFPKYNAVYMELIFVHFY